MLTLLLTFGLALACSVLATYWVRDLGFRLGVVDHPDAVRRVHGRATPRVGGWAVFLGAGAATLVPLAIGMAPAWVAPQLTEGLIPLGVGALAVFVLGLVDDLRDLRARTKFAVEVGVAVALFYAGLHIGTVSLGDAAAFTLPAWLDLPLTVFWFVGMANAYNLIDGHDGVAGGVALLALATISYAAVLNGNTPVAIPALALSGAVLGFLLFNLPPATVFLGDAGSLFLGFSLAGLGLIAVRTGPDNTVPLLVPVLALGLPVLDTSLAIMRRFLRGEPVFRPDRGHIHHRLRDMGYPKTVVTLFMWGLAGIFSLVAVMLLTQDPLLTSVGVTLAIAVSLVAIRWLETPEVMELGRTIHRALGQRHAIAQNVRLRDAVQLLDRAASAEDVDQALTHAFRDSGADHIEFRLPADWEEVLSGHPSFVREACGIAWTEGDGDVSGLWEVSVRLDLSTPEVGRLSLRYARPGPEALAHVDSVVRKLRPALCAALDRLLAEPPGVGPPGAGEGADEANGGSR